MGLGTLVVSATNRGSGEFQNLYASWLGIDTPIRYMLDLPQDMEEIVSTISEHTGAEIYMIAGWNDTEGVYHYYE